MDVLIDAPASDPALMKAGLMVGRTYADAPDVDGVCYVEGPDLEPGDLVPCTIVGASGYVPSWRARPDLNDLRGDAAAAPPRSRGRSRRRRR